MSNTTTPFLLTPLYIDKLCFKNRLWLAPMAGITDAPFRRICKNFGAGHAISEMVSADASLFAQKKSLQRANFSEDTPPICAQILGFDAKMMADAARYQVDNGAQMIDINMGCPAKKVCKKLAGSALLQDLNQVQVILQAVVRAVNVPVSLKTRLGYDNQQENILDVARICQDAGICAITIHGRTREDKYQGKARYALIKQVKQKTNLVVIANGDINSAQKAVYVQQYTGADAVMIGRSAQGFPWIFRQIDQYLQGETVTTPSLIEIHQTLVQHLEHLYHFYGEYSGCRIARKHIAWYSAHLKHGAQFRQKMYACTDTKTQFLLVQDFFAQLLDESEG